ncbi:MAG: hypothetical protein JO347_06245 [Candidatus Eremiobacteraeota bacterium]|nr:hypothetical protein [Candidatus Eremiobacteraeota bacterium]MBV8281651.1 hypothetical protein [Candidatus Eremiobacteraeota bacterium]
MKIFRVGSLREYGLVGKGPDGAPIARLNTPILFGGSVPSGVYVDTGQTYEHTTADLSKYYDFHQAGRYKFLFQTSITLELQTSTYAALKSNVVTLDVK